MLNEHLNEQLSSFLGNHKEVPDDLSGLLNAISDTYDKYESALAKIPSDAKTSDLLQRNKDLEQFTYIISHNLRAPVANIRALTMLLQRKKNDKKTFSRYLSGLEQSVHRLDEVITDLNNILNIRNEINEKKVLVRFSDITMSAADNIRSLIEKEQALIQTDFREIDRFFTIKSYLHSIFYNLISNSVKYRKPDEEPKINIRSRRLSDKIRLIFRDNSIGIDLQKNGDKIFGLYKRFHYQCEGKGMGLFMVKTQVETLGGKIFVNSEVNKGTEFTLEFDA